MVRAVWVGVAFVCGAVLAVIATRAFTSNPAAIGVPAAADAQLASAAKPNAPAAPAAAGDAPSALPERAPGTPKSASEPVMAAASSAASGLPTPEGPSADDSMVRHIDVGAAFHQQVDRPSVPGFPNEFGDAHRTLEREARDNSWSDSLEAEIRNSLTADVSSGNIKVEFLECRSTVCELRLSADERGEALNQWSANSGSFPWSPRLQSIGMSMSMSEGRTQGLWLFRKPPKPPK